MLLKSGTIVQQAPVLVAFFLPFRSGFDLFATLPFLKIAAAKHSTGHRNRANRPSD